MMVMEQGGSYTMNACEVDSGDNASLEERQNNFTLAQRREVDETD